MSLTLAILTAHTLPYPTGGSRGPRAGLPVQPGSGVVDRGCIPPPQRNWVRADISELKGQPLFGQRNRVLSAFVSGQNRKCILRFSKCVSSFKTQSTVAHVVIHPQEAAEAASLSQGLFPAPCPLVVTGSLLWRVLEADLGDGHTPWRLHWSSPTGSSQPWVGAQWDRA